MSKTWLHSRGGGGDATVETDHRPMTRGRRRPPSGAGQLPTTCLARRTNDRPLPCVPDDIWPVQRERGGRRTSRTLCLDPVFSFVNACLPGTAKQYFCATVTRRTPFLDAAVICSGPTMRQRMPFEWRDAAYGSVLPLSLDGICTTKAMDIWGG
jgi:hypothetical protein